ncbi:FAD-dependent oxidoreductase [Mycetocola tolaasinivorans]|uniref:FAD-dependent oxidoreductase n=1 Tax=Mycetocola tolaasinivorans TaxID=76635 RepID=A0A3L7A5T7_9MICO|nr:NAD(P)/FAD-dependent oxidoreductase [Mycetocola tolaasinivorans]RLP75703.1 FAD-dependent oxidoreductase [Mycetocola tolaasinivorans]
MTEITRDVVIIGAGASGLTAATDLKARGLTVAVLEARDRVGGRLWTDTIEGAMLEIGGQWVSPDQTALIETLDNLKLDTFSRYREGESIYIGRDGTHTRYSGDRFPVDAETAAEMDRLIVILDELAESVGATEPWAHPRAKELDSITWQAWLEENTDNIEARDNIGLFVAEAMLTKPRHAFSALQAILMAASAGSFSNLVDEDFILDKRVIGGLQQVPLRLAENLGEDVFLSQPVRRLEYTEDSVTAIADGITVHAKFAIMAVPPNLYSRVDYQPPLPRLKHQMHQHMSLGLVIKVHAVYETPFWREDGLSGTVFSPYQLVHEAYDNTNHEDPRGTLVGFVSDQHADGVFQQDAAARKAAILESLATYYGEQAKNPVVYYESDWGSEEWTRGAYATSFDMGGLERYGAMQSTPVGPIYWSSSDLAAEGFQHVDGAIRVGHDTAAAIIARHESQ